MRLHRLTTGALLLASIVTLVTGVILRSRGVVAQPTAEEPRPILRLLKNPTPLPAFSVKDINGQTISSANWRSKITLVNFWATWCPPCRAEIPALVALQQKYGDRLQIIGISEDEGPPDEVRQFVVEHKINYPVAMATPEIEHIFSGVSALPTSFFVDRVTRRDNPQNVSAKSAMRSGDSCQGSSRSADGMLLPLDDDR